MRKLFCILILALTSTLAYAQRPDQIELPCPSGSSPTWMGQSYDQATGKYRQWQCVKQNGTVTQAITDSGTGGQVFNVKAYGAKGDVQVVTDGAMTIGSPVLTSASGKFSSADQGKVIAVFGAGSETGNGGATLLRSTILSVQSSTSITLANTATQTASNMFTEWGTDDTADIQAALTAAWECSNGCTRGGGNQQGAGTVYFPPGGYAITSRLNFGDVTNGTLMHGAVIEGTGGNTTQIYYLGPTSDGALRISTCEWCTVKNLRIYDSHALNLSPNQSAFGLWWSTPTTSGGGHNLTENVDVTGFVNGIQIGDSLTDSALPSNTFINISLSGSYQGIYDIGSNNDGEFFYGLSGSSNQYLVRCQSCRNFHINGLEYSNSAGVAYDSTILFYADGGNLGTGGYSISNARIEQGTMLAWFGPQSGGNDSKLANLNINNVTYASYHAFTSPTTPTGVTATASTSGGSLAANTYYFKVSALDGGLGETLPSSEVSATTSGSTGSVTVSWPAVTNAPYYRVYWGTSAGAENQFAYVWGTTFTLTTLTAQLAGTPLATATTGTKDCLIHWGELGNVEVSNSTFANNVGSGAPYYFFDFSGISSSSKFSFDLKNTTLTSTSPDAIGSLVRTIGQGTGPSATAGLIYTQFGDIARSLTGAQSFMHNKIVRFTQADAENGTQSIMQDCGSHTSDGCILGSVNSIALQTTITGTTAGTAVCSEPMAGSSYKKITCFLSGYENTTVTAQTYTFPTAFANTPYLAKDDSGGSTVSTTTLTLPASMSVAKTGWVTVEGY